MLSSRLAELAERPLREAEGNELGGRHAVRFVGADEVGQLLQPLDDIGGDAAVDARFTRRSPRDMNGS